MSRSAPRLKISSGRYSKQSLRSALASSRFLVTRIWLNLSHTLCRPRRWPAHHRPALCPSTSQRLSRGLTTRPSGSRRSVPKSILKTNPTNTGVPFESQAFASERRDSTQSATLSTSKSTAPTSSLALQSTHEHPWCQGRTRTMQSDHSACSEPTPRNLCHPMSATAYPASVGSSMSQTEP